MRHLLTEQSVDYQLLIRLGHFYFENEHEHSYYIKKRNRLINSLMNIRLKTLRAKQTIILKTLNAKTL